MTVRAATVSDAADIAELLGELGYPAQAPDVEARLPHLDDPRSAIVRVAEVAGRVVGLATGHVVRSIHHTPPVAMLTALVVHSGHQGAGVGRELASAIEEWARACGATRISLTSGLHREGAHAFYERIGYVRSGVRLTKTFD